MEGGQRGRQDDDRRPRHPGQPFARDHQGEHHEQLLGQAQRDARGLRHEDRRHGEIERAAIEVEGVPRGHHERDDAPRHADRLHVLHRGGERGLRGRSRECDEGGLLHRAHEPAQRHFRQPGHRQQHRHPEDHECAIQRGHEQAQPLEDVQAAGGHGEGDCRPDPDRREAHHEAGELEHHLGDRLARAEQDVLGPAPDQRQRHREQHRPKDDLQHLVPRRRFEEALRHEALEHPGQREPLLRRRRERRHRAGLAQQHTGTRPDQVDHHEPDGQGQGGHDLEIDDRLQGQPPHPLQVVAVARDADHQGPEDERNDDRLDHPQKHGR